MFDCIFLKNKITQLSFKTLLMFFSVFKPEKIGADLTVLVNLVRAIRIGLQFQLPYLDYTEN